MCSRHGLGSWRALTRLTMLGLAVLPSTGASSVGCLGSRAVRLYPLLTHSRDKPPCQHLSLLMSHTCGRAPHGAVCDSCPVQLHLLVWPRSKQQRTRYFPAPAYTQLLEVILPGLQNALTTSEGGAVCIVVCMDPFNGVPCLLCWFDGCVLLNCLLWVPM